MSEQPHRRARGPKTPTPPPGPAPETLLAITLLASLLIWIPSLLAVLAGELEIVSAIIRYAFGLAFCWVGVHGLNLLMGGYARTNAAANAPEVPEHPGRRRSDQYTIEDDIDPDTLRAMRDASPEGDVDDEASDNAPTLD